MSQKSNISRIRGAVKRIYLNSVNSPSPRISWKELDVLLEELGIDKEELLKKKVNNILRDVSSGNHTACEVFNVLDFIENVLIPAGMGDESLKILEKLPQIKEDLWMGELMARMSSTLKKVVEKTTYSKRSLARLKESWTSYPDLPFPKFLMEL